MNREIKFRAWHKLNEIMIYEGWSKTVTGYDSWHDKATIFGYGESAEIMQFIGLYDKNNAPIYEGDIFKAFYSDTLPKNTVIFQDGAFGYRYYKGETYEYFVPLGKNEWFNWKNNKSEHIEIVGNIYESPELVK